MPCSESGGWSDRASFYPISRAISDASTSNCSSASSPREPTVPRYSFGPATSSVWTSHSSPCGPRHWLVNAEQPFATAYRIERERDLDQDLEFGVRQLTDTAVKAMSPGINDPTTACTCVGYLRSILARLAAREFPSPLRTYPEAGLTLVMRRCEFAEYLESLVEI